MSMQAWMRVIVGVALAGAAWCGRAVTAGAEGTAAAGGVFAGVVMQVTAATPATPTSKDSPGGTITGVVAEKGENWVRIRPEKGEAMRLMPKWVGGTEAQGGGLDKDMLSTINKLRIGEKVEAKWIVQERPRVIELTVLEAATKPAEPAEGASGTFVGTLVEKGGEWIVVKTDAGESQRFAAGAEAVSAVEKLRVGQKVQVEWKFQQRRQIVSVKLAEAGATGKPANGTAENPADPEGGTTTGKVTEKGANFIVVQPESGQAVKFMPRWIGGAPSAGGGLDKAMLKKMADVQVGDSVTVKWIQAEGQRIVELQVN
jgi:uncharacterized OB-fold protein